jgi:hypothetical protein
MPRSRAPERGDDRVLSGTRVVASLIVSFLVLAFAVLYR